METTTKSAIPAGPTHNGNNPASTSLITVQPPRREDLQPSYAQTLKGESEDAATHGWYGGMSKTALLSILKPLGGNRELMYLFPSQSAWLHDRLPRRHPMLHRLPESL